MYFPLVCTKTVYIDCNVMMPNAVSQPVSAATPAAGTTVNWVTAGYSTPIKDQGSCGEGATHSRECVREGAREQPTRQMFNIITHIDRLGVSVVITS